MIKKFFNRLLGLGTPGCKELTPPAAHGDRIRLGFDFD